MPRYKPIDIDEAYSLFRLRKTLLYRHMGKSTKLRFDKFCDMLENIGFTITESEEYIEKYCGKRSA